ncbi:ABATE domain-containing protein [Streptomyces sp. NPDC042638]|uniref:ABATE domain-containing protein n=1 Tax=Streptomyces sp. NPDC042638 TaxID=3154333 RepID=UPI0033CC4322
MRRVRDGDEALMRPREGRPLHSRTERPAERPTRPAERPAERPPTGRPAQRRAEPPLPPAPGAEQHPALDLANTALTLPGGQSADLLDTPSAARHWLAARGLAPDAADLGETCAGRLRALREQVRALLAARTDAHPAPAEALAALNHALTLAPAASLLHWSPDRGLYRAAAHPTTQIVEHALAALAADAADLLTGPDAERLTACGSPPCNRYLLRHGRRHWCSIRCGDRARAARAYARRTRRDTAE